MAEHLTPDGARGNHRAEGFIFQSQTAYKALRKMLVDSASSRSSRSPRAFFLPVTPASRRSILILDRGLNRRSDAIAFFKVETTASASGVAAARDRRQRTSPK
jgi:type I restriction enzyme M protein